jgi:predicted XRE-type DNA-binding protein
MAAVQGREIKAWLVRHGIKVNDVARAVGVDQSLVSHCLAGRKRAEIVRNHLRQLGCPAEYFGMGQKKAAA